MYRRDGSEFNNCRIKAYFTLYEYDLLFSYDRLEEIGSIRPLFVPIFYVLSFCGG